MMSEDKKIVVSSEYTLGKLYSMQASNQREMLHKGVYDRFIGNGYEMYVNGLPVDSINLSSYHMQQLISEVGEVLDADKRWKSFRNDKFDKDAKLEEIADCFIELLNISMFSGIDAEELNKAIARKIKCIASRVSEISDI